MAAPNAETRLYRDVIKNSGYNPQVRPNIHASQPINVDVEFELLSIGQLVSSIIQPKTRFL